MWRNRHINPPATPRPAEYQREPWSKNHKTSKAPSPRDGNAASLDSMSRAGSNSSSVGTPPLRSSFSASSWPSSSARASASFPTPPQPRPLPPGRPRIRRSPHSPDRRPHRPRSRVLANQTRRQTWLMEEKGLTSPPPPKSSPAHNSLYRTYKDAVRPLRDFQNDLRDARLRPQTARRSQRPPQKRN